MYDNRHIFNIFDFYIMFNVHKMVIINIWLYCESLTSSTLYLAAKHLKTFKLSQGFMMKCTK